MNTPPIDPPKASTPSAAEHTSEFDGASPRLQETGLGFLKPSSRLDSLGRLAHYECLELLGRGGFGIVFRAFDDALRRVVAIKVLAPELAATSPARKRFLREARAAAQIRHENVVHLYAVEEQPLPYLVMEFVPGETLQQRLERTGPFDAAEVVAIGRQIAEGLAAAHACTLIHRDIKPANILVESGPPLRVKITDFGLARAEDDASITQSGLVAGTPLYMSPEQARGDALDHRTDLFSLGSVLYTITSGHPPFRSGNTLAILKRVSEDIPRPISEIIPETPVWLCRLIETLMAKEPADRYQTAAQVVAAFQSSSHEPGEAAARLRRRRTSIRLIFLSCAVAASMLFGAFAIYHFKVQNRPDNDATRQVDPGDQTKGNEQPVLQLPDLAKLNLLFDDDFSDPAKCVVPGVRRIKPTRENPAEIKDAAARIYIQDQRFVIELLHTESGSPMAWAGSGFVTNDDFVCMMRCRLTGNGDVGWAFLHEDGKHAIAVSVELDGRIEVSEVEQPGNVRRRLQRLRPPVGQLNDQETTLLVTLQGRKLTVFIDGRAMGAPVELERGFGAGKQSMVAWRSGRGDAKAEFSRFAMWRLSEPSPQQGQ